MSSTGTQPDLTVGGLVRYDALASVATQLQASPQNTELRNDWRSLLQTIGAGELSEQPLLGSVIHLEEISSDQ